MNGIHDLGGMDGFRVPARDQGFALHEEWERLTWGMLLATSATPGLPAGSRRFIESLPPERYLACRTTRGSRSAHKALDGGLLCRKARQSRRAV
jgi:hypothetical protein